MKFNVDCHFHPNLPKSRSRSIKRCTRWWKELEKYNINVIICTEHAYKNPKRAFEIMQKTCPKGSTVIPGMEYITKEGVDVIVFAQKPTFYNYKELQPFRMTFKQTVAFIKKKKLKGLVVHPYLLGLTSIINTLGYTKYLEFTKKIGGLEVANTTLEPVKELLSIFPFTKKKIERIKKVTRLPAKDIPNVQFLTAGSDAHHFYELGTYLQLDCTQKKIFKAIASNKEPIIVFRKVMLKDQLKLVRRGLTAFHEYLIKRFIRWSL